jgi:hypothetical protein
VRYNKVCVGKHLSDNVLIQNDLKQDALSPLLSNFALAYAFKMVKENQDRLKIKESLSRYQEAGQHRDIK